MEPTKSIAGASVTVKSATCVLFAYHEMGHACMSALLKMGAPIAALFTHRDDPHEEIWWNSCAELAERSRVPVHTPERIDTNTVAKVAALKPSIIYSFYYRYLIPESVLGLAPLGAYNMHGSLLPKYRGRAPVNWMIVNG
ncbi:MAG TPA: formyltransferase family protein [Candidatus Acidoferrales bacterium]|nr:formyltransferase family protein [Candidatus Acidoferrales bacterium]